MNKEERYQELIMYCNKDDIERKALFYILAHVDKLWDSRELIYNFKNSELNNTNEKCASFKFWSSSEKALLKLAKSLYSGGWYEANVYETFLYLDPINTNAAIEAIRIRFVI